MLFAALAATSDAVAATSKRNEKVELLAARLAELDRAEPDEIVAAVAFLTGTTPLGRIGVGWAALSERRPPPAGAPTLSVGDVDRALRRLEAMSGPGVQEARRSTLGELWIVMTEPEQRLLAGILSGELRQGANEGVMATAIAAAAGPGVTVAATRRAAMFAGDLAVAAVAALTGGGPALEEIGLEPGRAVQPMLASTSASVADALEAVGAADAADADVGSAAPASIEWKLDGARIQAHRRDGEVRLFTRNLNEVTDRLPGVVAAVRRLPGGDLVLDGEVMGVDDDGRPRAFQDTIGDFAADAAERPDSTRGATLQAWFFDVLFADGRPVVDEPLSQRRRILERVVGADSRPPSIVTADVALAGEFFDETVAAGHEGVMVKDLTAPYEAGRRGKGWRKVKPVHTLDLVVLAVEWGSGRRRGWLSNIHLGARNDGTVGDGRPFVMVGKTFKGMTDEMLRWQTERFGELRVDDDADRAPWERHRGVVRVRPEQVVEIAVDGVQRSTTYPGGVALRFARVKRYRSDKSAAEADTISTVRNL